MAGHHSGWVKVGYGKLKGKSVFISKAIKEKYGYKAINALNAAGDAQYGPIFKKIMDSQPTGQAQLKLDEDEGDLPGPSNWFEAAQGDGSLLGGPQFITGASVLANLGKKSPIVEKGAPGAWPAQLAATKPSPGFNEVEEAQTVMAWDGMTAVKKPGITTEQTKRFYARRDAVKAADATKMKDGKSVREHFDAFFADGGWSVAGVISGGRLRLTGPGDSELVLKEVVAKNYAKVALNYGDLARTY